MPDTKENHDELTEPQEPAKDAAKPEAPEPAQKHADKHASKSDSAKKPLPTVGLPVFIVCVVAAVVVGVLCGHFLLGGGPTSFSLNGTTKLTSDQLDSTIAEYTYDGKSNKVTAREVLAQNGSVDKSADSDGNYTVPAATDVISYARNQIVLDAAGNQNITVSDDEVDQYANKMFGSSDYSQIASQYNIDEDTAKDTIKQSAVMSKLRDSVVSTQVPDQPTAPTKPTDGAEDTPTADYAQYIIGLAGDEWDADNNTWKSQDGDYAKALASYEVKSDSATYAAAQAAYYVAQSKYSTASSQMSSEWTAYCNELLSKATIQIGSLAV